MSKDDTCKVSSASKHKERKPKKPHYIPRPWGKPYNYKCFQCPFTCMEKSHLYNHMKYSLCKNSLSLLIESDWPYKKGNVLHPDQLRSFQQGLRNSSRGGEGEEREKQRRAIEEEDGEEREAQEAEEEEERERSDGRDVTGATKETSVDTKAEAVTELRRPKQADSDLLMADVLSLEEQLLRARSADVEAQLKHYKLSKNCLTTPGLLSEHWRLLTQNNHTTKTKPEPRVSSSIPCYPPPPGLADYPDPTAGLNLSVLGVGYPISPGLFSYMNSAIPTAASSVVTQNQIAQQLPFLASMHPASGAPSPIPPRLYYPFLCEHTFGQTEPSKSLKTTASNLESNALSGFQPKVSLWKVPAVRPGAVQATGWGSSPRETPEQSFKGEKPQVQAKEGKAVWGVKRTGAPLVDAPAEKKQSVGFTLDLLKNFQTASSLNLVADKLLLQNNLADAPPLTQPLDSWYKDALSPNSETSSLSNRGGANALDSAHSASSEASSESVAALLTDLSKALRDYQEAERKISHMEAEDVPAQRDLWEHLSKIRSELSHIHQALEQTSRPSDGPLDLSVKKDSDPPRDELENYKNYKDSNATETEEEEDEETEAKTASLESRKQSLDLLIKMSQTAVVTPDVLGANEALWPSRTTKCEADSSVLLCPDGRSVVFTEISGKTQKRPSSLQRFENQCPHSPMTAAEN